MIAPQNKTVSQFAVIAFISMLALSLSALAQPKPANPADHAAHATHAASDPATAPSSKASLADQVAELRVKVANLKTALQQRHAGNGAAAAPGMGSMGAAPGATAGSMPGMGAPGMGGMRGMNDMMGMSRGGRPMGQAGAMPGGGTSGGGMSGGGMGGMGMMQGMMQSEMGGMGSMPGGGGMGGMMGMSPGAAMGGMAMPSALPGFPGASHLYHIGSTGFFLDHGAHVTLTTQQQMALNAAKEKALLDKASTQRMIDGAEQELWTLTASDKPDAANIEAKVREIEKLRGEQRLTFIRAVGEAAKALTDEQRKSLLGQLPPQTSQTAPAGGMGDM